MVIYVFEISGSRGKETAKWISETQSDLNIEQKEVDRINYIISLSDCMKGGINMTEFDSFMAANCTGDFQ